jgi:hypothetical protein
LEAAVCAREWTFADAASARVGLADLPVLVRVAPLRGANALVERRTCAQVSDVDGVWRPRSFVLHHGARQAAADDVVRPGREHLVGRASSALGVS